MTTSYISHLETKSKLLDFEASIHNSCDVQTQYVYESVTHAQNILSSLNDQRKQGVLCDITVIVEGVRIPAHKAVLAACSTYFNGLITDPDNISHNIVLELSSVSRVAMESLLEFAYTSKLTISRKNITQILDAIRELDIKNIEHSCLSTLKERLLSNPAAPTSNYTTSTTQQEQQSATSEQPREKDVSSSCSSVGVSKLVDEPRGQFAQPIPPPPLHSAQASLSDGVSRRKISTTSMEAPLPSAFNNNHHQHQQPCSNSIHSTKVPPSVPASTQLNINRNSTNYCPAMASLSLRQQKANQTISSSGFGPHACPLPQSQCCIGACNSKKTPPVNQLATSSSTSSTSTSSPHVAVVASQPSHQHQQPIAALNLSACRGRTGYRGSGGGGCPLLITSSGKATTSSDDNYDDGGRTTNTQATCVSFAPHDDDDGDDGNHGNGGKHNEMTLSCCTSSSSTSTASTSQQSSSTSSSTNVVLPFSFDQITKLPRTQLHELLSQHPDLTQKQLNTIHELRRRGKNRIAAQRCRKRKMDFIKDLQEKMGILRDEHSKLMEERLHVTNQAKNLTHNFQALWKQVFIDTCMKKSKKCCMNMNEEEIEALQEDEMMVQSVGTFYKNEMEKLESFTSSMPPCENLPDVSTSSSSAAPPATTNNPSASTTSYDVNTPRDDIDDDVDDDDDVNNNMDELVIVCQHAEQQQQGSGDLF